MFKLIISLVISRVVSGHMTLMDQFNFMSPGGRVLQHKSLYVVSYSKAVLFK